MESVKSAMSEKDANWLADLKKEDCVRLDVRPILATGVDPLDQILVVVETLDPEDTLLIEAPFDPLPLRRLLAGRGYISQAVPCAERHWQVFFRKGEGQDVPQVPGLPDLSDLPDFPVDCREGELDMDLRGLVAPNPLIAVLKVIESGAGGASFVVRLLRDPIYLHPELAERNWSAVVLEDTSEGLVVRLKKGRQT